MAILNVVFDQSQGLITITDTDPNFLSTHGLLYIIDPAGVEIYKNTGYDSSDFTSPDLDTSSTSFSIALPTASDGSFLSGTYYFYYKSKDINAVAAEVNPMEKIVDWSFQEPEICINHVTSCICSTIELTDGTSYSDFQVSAWAWDVAPPAHSGLSNSTGADSSLTVGANIWSGYYEAKLTVTGSIDNGDNVSTIGVVSGFSTIKVDCASGSNIYSSLSSIKEKYDTYAAKSPTSAALYLPTLHNATAIAVLAEKAYELGQWSSYETLVGELEGMAPDCACGNTSCSSCSSSCSADTPTEIIPVCGGGSGSSSSSGLDNEAVMDLISTFFQAGANIQLDYDDTNNTFTVSFVPTATATTPENASLRYNITTGEYEVNGANGTFVRVQDGGTYSITPQVIDPVIHVQEGAVITLPDPDTMYDHTRITIVCENTDSTEPPNETVASIRAPKGKWATINNDSFGLNDFDVNTGDAEYDIYEVLNGRQIVIGIVENLSGDSHYAIQMYGTRWPQDPKLLLDDFYEDTGLEGGGLKWSTTAFDQSGYPGAFVPSFWGKRVIKVAANATYEIALPEDENAVIYAEEGATVQLPDGNYSASTQAEFIIVHENSSANQSYAASSVNVQTLQGTTVFATIGDGVLGTGLEPNLVTQVNADVQQFSINNGEAVYLVPYSQASNDNYWVVVQKTNRFAAVSTGGSATWGNITGTLSAQSDLQAALDGKLATATYTAADVASKYASQVGQVAAGEITNGTETALRTYSPADIKAFIDTHGSGGGAWGSISGTLSNQTDLQTALDDKLDSSSYTANDVLSKYNSVVGQISSAEIAAGTESAVRRFSPADVKSMIDTHGITSVEWGNITGTLANQTDLQASLASKLDTSSYTAADVASKYASVVGQVSSAEISAGTETGLRTYSPADVKSMIDTHGPTAGTKFVDTYDDYAALIAAHATPPTAGAYAILREDVELVVEDGGVWVRQYQEAYSITSATEALLESSSNFTNGVYSGSAIAAEDLVVGKRHVNSTTSSLIYLCVDPASPYWVRFDLSDSASGAAAWGSITGTLSSQTDLQSALDAKLASSTYTASDVASKYASQVGQVSAGEITVATETALRTYSPADIKSFIDTHGGGSGSTNLGYTPSATDGTVTSSSGSDATIPLGDGTNAGLESPAHWQTVEDAVDVNGSGIQDGDIIEYSSANVRFDPVRLEKVDATAGDVGSVKLNSPYFTNIYGAPNPHTQSTVVVDATTLREGGSAKIRIQSAAKPSGYTLAGATFTEVGDWSGWSASGVNVIGMECETAGGSAIIKLYYAGTEA